MLSSPAGASTAFHGLKKLQLSGLDTIAIFGAGPVGLAGVMFAAEMGARVISVDISGERLEMAKSAGAWAVVDNSNGSAVDQILDLTYGEGADATLLRPSVSMKPDWPRFNPQRYSDVAASWAKAAISTSSPVQTSYTGI